MTKEKCVVENFCKIEDIKILDYDALNLALKRTNFITWNSFTKKVRLSKESIEKILDNKIRTSKGNLYFLMMTLLCDIDIWCGDSDDEEMDPKIKLNKLRNVYNVLKDEKYEDLDEYEILDYVIFQI